MRRAAPTERRVPVLPVAANLNAAVARDRRSSALLRLLVRRLAIVRDGAAAIQAYVARATVEVALDGVPTRADLERLRDAHLRREALLERAIRELGGQPAAALRAVGTGPLVIHWNDDDVTPCHTLERLLAGPLRDDDAWLVLADLANEAGRHELAVWLGRAAADHDHDRAAVHRWMRALQRPRPDAAQDSGVTTSSE